MASISSKVMFVTTSPRTPSKMIPEIRLLNEYFNGSAWNVDTQTSFMELLREENFFNGTGSNDPAFSARDRMNRAPQSLGFITLYPKIELTPAGRELISAKKTEDIFLRQLLKFQIPSPYHSLSAKAGNFWIKPYLEMFRLIRDFGSLTFDEFKIFVLQLLDYREYENLVNKINDFRRRKALNKEPYKKFIDNVLQSEVENIYKEEILRGDTKTRETSSKSIDKFISTKASNMRDYTDACFRYLRATGMVAISKSGKSISIIPEKMEEVNFFLSTINREPCYIDDVYHYLDYLGNAETPKLYTDDRDYIINVLQKEYPQVSFDKHDSILRLKDILRDCIDNKKTNLINKQVKDIKNKILYNDIDETFNQIVKNSIYDASLMLEWNTWRAMTMIDGGDIKANLSFDDFGQPMSTAQGNMADIVCEYETFRAIVEVTLSTGQRQYEMEGEPVARHLAKIKMKDKKEAFCLFVAPSINPACLSQFFYLHKIPIQYYGGTSNIIPLELSIFRKMVEDSYKASYIPSSKTLYKFFKAANELATNADNEEIWYQGVKDLALNWLT